MAIATQIPVREWRDESDEIIATTVQLLEEQAKESRRKK